MSADGSGNMVGVPFEIAPTGSRDLRLAENGLQAEIVAVYKRSGDIHIKRMDYAGAPVGIAYAITNAPGEQYAPRISSGVWEKHLVAWTDLRAGMTEADIYGQWLELEPILGAGEPLGNELPGGGTSHYQAPAQINQWYAIGIRPGPVGDLDLYLADGPDYNTVLVSSIYGVGLADIVVIDGYQSGGPAAYFPYVQHFSGDTFYNIEFAPRARKITRDSPLVAESLGVESIARIFDIYAVPGQLLDIALAPDVSDLAIALFDPRNGAHQALNQALIVADTGGGGHAEHLQFLPVEEEWHGLLV